MTSPCVDSDETDVIDIDGEREYKKFVASVANGDVIVVATSPAFAFYQV